MQFDTETIDRLFLELAQFSTAVTNREAKLMQQVSDLVEAAAPKSLIPCPSPHSSTKALRPGDQSMAYAFCSVLTAIIH